MTTPQEAGQMAQNALTVATPLAPLLGPNAVVAVTVANALLSAVMGAMATGSDVTDAQLDALMDADQAARMRNELARKQIAATAAGQG